MKKVDKRKKEMKRVVEIESSENDGTPLRPIFCLKRKMDTKPFDDVHDCFILDFDPSECISNLSFSFDDDLSVVAEKGKVACRDYPHSRHLCLKYPFDTTPHEKFCQLCYCYVCDAAAPCKSWKDPKLAHCNASENIAWKLQRKLRRKNGNIVIGF